LKRKKSFSKLNKGFFEIELSNEMNRVRTATLLVAARINFFQIQLLILEKHAQPYMRQQSS